VLLVVLAASFPLWAQQPGVFISFRGPERATQPSRDAYEEIRSIIEESLKFKLSTEFLIEDVRDKADYVVELHITGPLQGCMWQVSCHWQSEGASGRKNCWEQIAYLPYCGGNSLEEIQKIGCLANYIKLGSAPQTLPENLFEPEAPQDQSTFKVVYTRCFKLQLEDEIWKSRLRLMTTKIPLLIMRELEADFREHGYDIFPEDCSDTDEEPEKVDVEIWGFVEEVPDKDRLYVELFVHERRPLGQPDGFLRRLGGRTREIEREEYRNLGDAIIDYIRECFDGNN
jgi:hypothetical protein